MRLRIRIERNSLPPVQTIWPISKPRSTIAQLLESLDRTFPLGGAEWGLEDYSVSIEEFELLHYQEIQDVCRDEDVLVVKPLSYRELRTRTLLGRNQITSDGRHLMDGVPFGRPLLKKTTRPQVKIPSRKDESLDSVNEDMDRGEEELQRLLLMEQAHHDDEDGDDDEDFAPGLAEDDMESSEEAEETEEDEAMDEEDEASEWEGIDGVENSAPKLDNISSQSEDADSSSEISDSSSAISSTSSEDSEGEDDASPNKSSQPKAVTTRGQPANPGTKRKRSSDPGEHVIHAPLPLSASSNKSQPSTGLPYQGHSKSRNDRRRDTKRLMHLVEEGKLPQGSTLQDYRQFEHSHQASQTPDEAAATLTNGTTHIGENQQSEENKTNAAPRQTNGLAAQPLTDEPTPVSKKAKKNKVAPENLEAQRQKLLAQIANGGIDVTNGSNTSDADMTSNAAAEGVEDGLPPDILSSKAASNIDSRMVPPAVTRRARLNVGSAQRLLFGSLGVRAPKTQEDRDKLQLKLAVTSKGKGVNDTKGDLNSVPATNGDVETQAEEEQDPDAWRSKIRLRAVECCDENVKLSEPPFPFRQRWCPQQHKRKRAKKGRGLHGSNGESQSAYVETYDKYNINGDGDALDYDDVEHWDDTGDWNDHGDWYDNAGGYWGDDQWEEGALLGDDDDDDAGGQGVNGESKGDESADGFPPLPANVDELPSLRLSELQTGDLITYGLLACDATTNWEPKMVTRSAQVLTVPEDDPEDEREWTSMDFSIRVAKRDLMTPKWDDEGNRIYEKFEMPQDEDEDAELAGEETVQWDSLIDTRLLLRRPQFVKPLAVSLPSESE